MGTWDTILVILGSRGTPNRQLEVQVSIFIDDGKRFQAVDVFPFRSKTFNVGGVGGEWVPVLDLGFFFNFFAPF